MLMVDSQHTWNSTLFYPGFSKQNITSVQAPILRNNSNSGQVDNHVLCHRLPNFVTAAAWYGIVFKANGMARTIAFPFRRRRKNVICCFIGRDFLSLRTTRVVSDIWKLYHILLLQWSVTAVTMLRSLKSGIRECIIRRTNFCSASSWPKWHM